MLKFFVLLERNPKTKYGNLNVVKEGALHPYLYRFDTFLYFRNMAWGNAYPKCVISVWTMLAYILYAIIPNEVCDADDINACRE